MNLPALAQEYPYFAGSLLLWCLALAALASARGGHLSGYRRSLAFSAALCLPYALFSFEYIPAYWNPRLVAWLGIVSVEDLLFSSATGLLCWWVATWSLRRGLALNCLENDGWAKQLWPQAVTRYLLVGILGVGLGYAVRFGVPGTPVMTSTLWGIGVSGVVLLWLERRLWPLALRGALAFAIGYAALVKLMFLAWPGFMEAWGLTERPHVWLGGIPLYELLWAAGFGAVWPLFMGWCFGAVVNEEQPSHGIK